MMYLYENFNLAFNPLYDSLLVMCLEVLSHTPFPNLKVVIMTNNSKTFILFNPNFISCFETA